MRQHRYAHNTLQKRAISAYYKINGNSFNLVKKFDLFQRTYLIFGF